MNNLANKITAYLGSKPDFNKEVLLQNDMVDGISNPYIAEWNITEKPKPTDAELNALEDDNLIFPITVAASLPLAAARSCLDPATVVPSYPTAKTSMFVPADSFSTVISSPAE